MAESDSQRPRWAFDIVLGVLGAVLMYLMLDTRNGLEEVRKAIVELRVEQASMSGELRMLSYEPSPAATKKNRRP